MRILTRTNQVILHDAQVKANDGVMITSSEIDIKPESGGFSLHDVCVVHGSEPNPNNDFRKIYTMQYANADTTSFTPDKYGQYLYFWYEENYVI